MRVLSEVVASGMSCERLVPPLDMTHVLRHVSALERRSRA